MKINRTILGVVATVAMVAAFASSALSDQVTVTRVAGYYTGSGGEFNLVPLSGSLGTDMANYDVKAIVGKGFESFCVERNEGITPGNTYYYQTGPDAIKGGTTTSDPISIGAAYLYTMFATGGLTGYNYTPGALRAASAGLLQQAIWWLEDEVTLTQSQIDNNKFLKNGSNTGAVNKYGQIGAKADNNYWLVDAINMGTTSDGNRGLWPVQDMLVLTGVPSVPDGGTTLILLGMAMTALVAVQRRSRMI